MPVYGYTRVSTTEQAADDRSSLTDQERRIRGAAMVHGHDDPIIFSDPGVSGAIPLAKRPGGSRLITVLQAGDVLIAAKLDRLFRATSDALTTAEAMQAQKVSLILLDCGTEPVTGSGSAKLFFSMLAAFAEFEKNRILERMSDGRKGKSARGGHIGGLAPYGYRVDGTGTVAMLIEDPAEQSIIARVRKLRDAGDRLRTISATLERDGIVSRNGKAFAATQLARMLEP